MASNCIARAVGGAGRKRWHTAGVTALMVKFTDWLSGEPFEVIEEEAKKARRRFLAVYSGED